MPSRGRRKGIKKFRKAFALRNLPINLTNLSAGQYSEPAQTLFNRLL